MATGWLKEVEEDAEYIQTKRFQEHYEEQNRAAEKQKRVEEKQEVLDNKKGK